MKTLIKNRIRDCTAFLAGLVLPFAFAPFNYSFLAILSPAFLLTIWLFSSPAQAFRRGWLFGLGFFGLGIYWVYISLRVYGYSSIFFAVLATMLLIAIYALFPAILGYLLNRLFPYNNIRKTVLLFPAGWTLLEWIRSWLFTGFPWLSLGYSQINSPLAGLAPIVGVYGVTLAVVTSSGMLVALLYYLRKCLHERKLSQRWRNMIMRHFSPDTFHQSGFPYLGIALILLFLWLGSAALYQVSWTKPRDNAIKVSLIQGNIPQQEKWQSENVHQILSLYLQLTRQHLDSDLIVWPEAAIVIADVDAKDYLQMLSDLGKQNHLAILAGIPVYKNFQFYNALLALGDGTGVYYKHHLLPFGDYIPLRFIFDIFNKFVQIPMSDFSHGPLPQPVLVAKGVKIAAFICYEIVFPEEVIKSLPQAELLVLVTDDSWFGNSFASDQHLEMGQMRALETGRYLLFTGNSGITAIINQKGRIVSTIPPFQQMVLTGTAQPMQGSTPYVRWGNYLVLIIIAGMLFFNFKHLFHRR